MGEGENQPNPVTINLPRPNYFAWGVAIAAIALAAILLSKSCKKDIQIAETQAQADTLAANNERYHTKSLADSATKDSLISVIQVERKIRQAGKDSDWIVIAALQRANKGLPGRILQYVPVPGDTAGMAAQSRRCDSAAIALAAGSKTVDDLKFKDSLTAAAYEAEIAIRMQYERDQINLFDSCWANSSKQGRLLNQVIDKNKPRNIWFLGVEIIGGQKTLFTNVGGVISILGKGGKLYQLSGGVQSIGGGYGSFKASFPLRFHK